MKQSLEMYLWSSGEEWGFILNDSHFPTSVDIYCGFLVTLMIFAFKDNVVDILVNVIIAVAGDP